VTLGAWTVLTAAPPDSAENPAITVLMAQSCNRYLKTLLLLKRSRVLSSSDVAEHFRFMGRQEAQETRVKG
jgi:hypothetical protein